MSATSSLDPSQRQILVNLGNRYVVFGPSTGQPQPIHFDADTDTEVLPRVADESEVAEARIVETLRVRGMKASVPVEGTIGADVELVDDDGNHVLIDIKVRERDPKRSDYDQGFQRLTEAADIGQKLEVWLFNIERLKLVVMHRGKRGGGEISELTPLDVWEKTTKGVFKRARVAEDVKDWLFRVGAMYDDVRVWLCDRPSLRCEQTRTVIMSEEMMQNFAVTDQEVPVLDVIDADQVIASFVPRGLWMIGAWGRIDVITRDWTHILVALRSEGNLEWRLVSPQDRRRTELFDKNALLALVRQS